MHAYQDLLLARALQPGHQLVLDEILEVGRDIEQLDRQGAVRFTGVDAHHATGQAEPATAAVEPEVDPDERADLGSPSLAVEEHAETADGEIDEPAGDGRGAVHDGAATRRDPPAAAALARSDARGRIRTLGRGDSRQHGKVARSPSSHAPT